jgi:beta-lactamase regulating signal transducer with metallopeptidase domain
MILFNLALLLRGALVLALASVAVLLLWRASANLRRTVLVWGFVAALLTPILTLALERTPAPQAVAVATSWARPRIDPMFEPVSSYRWRRASAWIQSDAMPRGAAERLGVGWMTFLLVAGILSLRLLFSHLRVARLVWRARPADEIAPVIARAEAAASATARVCFSADVQGPIATGVLTPRVLLPEEARDWSEARLYTVLVHELTHVRQRDALAQLVAELTCAVQWWNPIAWWAKQRLERERELAADERVLASGMLPSAYAGELLAIATELGGVRMPRAGVPVVGRSKLALRIEKILAEKRARMPRAWQRVALPMAAVLVMLLVACASTTSSAVATRASGTPKRVPAGTSSIEPTIQRVVDAETARTQKEWSTEAVTVVVLEPKTGRVVALGNPALASANRTPGSTFKPLVVAAALETGAIQPDDRFDCEKGERKYPDGVTLRDAGSFGELDVTEILAQSSNVGLSKIFDKLGGPTLTNWFTRFHLNEPALDASAGSLGALDDTSAGTMKGAVIAIGVGAKVSPLHLAAMYGAFANQGLYVPPSLERRPSAKPERVLEATTAARVLGMLESAVERGTGKAAQVSGVRVAGKTGTADLRDTGSDDHSIAYFAGIVPADAPRYVIVVVVEDPKEAASGGRAAAPVFARIASQIL